MIPAFSDFSHHVDMAFLFVAIVSLFFMVVITVAMLWFLYRYSHLRNPHAAEIRENTRIEVLWTVIPSILVMLMFAVGLEGFVDRFRAPADALHVEAHAQMWNWSFTYAGGARSDSLRVPVGRAVRVDLKSTDVIHSLFIPAMRVKLDAVPGVPTTVWFRPEKVGDFEIFCAEFCGTRHSYMLSRLQVLPAAEFDAWLADRVTGGATRERTEQRARAGK